MALFWNNINVSSLLQDHFLLLAAFIFIFVTKADTNLMMMMTTWGLVFVHSLSSDITRYLGQAHTHNAEDFIGMYQKWH